MPTRIYIRQGNVFNCLTIIIFCTLFTKSALTQPVLSLTPVIETGLVYPVQFVNAGDGTKRVFIVQQGGAIRSYDSAFHFLAEFLIVSEVSSDGERGLLSMAFHPDYKNNGLFYVYYTNTAGDLELARYHVSSDPNVADPATKVKLITIAHPINANHNGGELHFGNDGYLYLSTGDGGGAGDVDNNAQNSTKLLGKMLRFNVNTGNVAPYYTIPAGNPNNNEIFDLGLRNPFRWSFDRLTNDMWIGDVGQASFEEINYRPAALTGGVNYGWHCYEGNADYDLTGCGPVSNYVFPVFTYSRGSTVSASVTGGIVYRGTMYPSLQGYYLSADVYSGNFYKTVSDGAGGWNTSVQLLSPIGIVDFGETEDAEAYAVSLTPGSVYHITASGPLPVTFLGFSGALNNQGVKLGWQTVIETNLRQFQIEYSVDGSSFTYLGTVSAQNKATGSGYSFLHPITYEGTLFYRLKIVNLDGSWKYSTVIRVVSNGKGKSIIAPSVINSGQMIVNLEAQTYNSLELISINGLVVLRKNVAGQTGQIKVPVGTLSTGVYMVRLTGNSTAYVQKIFIQ